MNLEKHRNIQKIEVYKKIELYDSEMFRGKTTTMGALIQLEAGLMTLSLNLRGREAS